MQGSQVASSSLNLNPYLEEQDQAVEIAGKLSQDFTAQLKLQQENSQLHDEEEEDHEREDENEDEDEESEEDDDDFSFARAGDDNSPIAADMVFQDSQIRQVFPLFNQDLLLSYEDYDNQLPLRPPVEKFFVEKPPHPSSSSSLTESEGVDGVAEGPYCAWSKKPDEDASCKKSNSTGFSKLWRVRDNKYRSNSDGRDTFVFLNNSPTTTSTSTENTTNNNKMEKVVASPASGESSSAAKKATTAGEVKANGKAKVKKSQKMSAYEIYMRNRGEDRPRSSYLPYRPELMGFFTNVNGGLSRNVHPF